MLRSVLVLRLLFNAMVSAAQTDSSGRDSIHTLHTVIVQGKWYPRVLTQQPFHVSVVEAAPFHNTNVTGTDLLRQVAGIKIRQNGGFGSVSDVFINGSAGKQVKFFIDGLPQDNLGETQSLNIFPVEQIERLEIYKGVIPAELGADVLGAAVNIVTNKERQDYFNGSYTLGSFHTHKLDLVARKNIGQHFFTSVQTNFNYAGNDYRVQAAVIKPNGQSDNADVRLFHDHFKNYNLRVQAGIANTSYADQLFVTLLQTGSHDELQHSLMMMQPYGYAFKNELLQSIILRYQKNLILPHTDVNAMFSYNRVNSFLLDTSKYIFLWNGEVARDLAGQPQRKFSGGELSSSGHALNIFNNVLNGKITGIYHLTDETKLVLSNTILSFRQTGSDPVAQQFYNGTDYYSTPSVMVKNVSALGIDGKIRKSKWRYLATIKHYYAAIMGFEIVDLNKSTSQQSYTALAWNGGLGYQWNEHLLLKISCEHAARMPEPDEAFGDFTYVTANPGIHPEKSDNVNLVGVYHQTNLEAEASIFYRDTKDLIYLPPSQFYSRYDNLLHVRGIGVESNLRYRIGKHVTINANATYQDLRNQSDISNRPIDNGRYKNSRMPNIPYLFANSTLVYALPGIFKANNILQVWYTANYTHDFFLYWAEDGDSQLKNRLPIQLLHGAGISYSLEKGISLAIECTNITNTQTCDNFKVQLPGRAFSFKLRFYQKHKK